MSSRIYHLAALSVLLLLSGCAYNITPYSSSGDNQQSLASLQRQGVKKASVGKLEATAGTDRPITCRAAGSISPPEGKTYSQYIQDALIKELKTVGLYAPDSQTVIKGRLTKIDFSSALSGGSWHIEAEFMVDGKTIRAVTNYPFESAFVADAACTRVANALAPAVQSLLNKLFSKSGFALALKQ